MGAEGKKQDAGVSKLNAWLDRATHGLCAQAKERVQREITAHHAEAVEHLRETGVAPDVADAQALEGLGDAATAGKALRKTYLSGWQQRLLAGLSEPVKPLTTNVYADIVLNTAQAPLVALLTVYYDFKPNPYLACLLGVAVVILVITLIARWKTTHSVRNRVRKWRNKAALPCENPAANRLYPWCLTACYLSLYAAWRCYHLNTVLATGSLVDLCLVLGGGTLYCAKIHRVISAYCFSSSRQSARRKVSSIISYIAFLGSASVACVFWPPSLSLISWFLLPVVGFDLGPTYYRSPEEGVDAFLYGMIGIILALVLCIAAIRWTIGLYLHRKDVNGDGTAEPGPMSCPEKPLGE